MKISKWIPDRKVWSGGVMMIAAFGLTLASNTYLGTDFDEASAFFISIGLGKAVEYVLPPSIRDILKRIDNDIVATAGSTPLSDVSGSVGRAALAAGADPMVVTKQLADLRSSSTL